MSVYTIFIFFVIYFICSINPAIIICKLKTGEDIRKLGSGNAGPTNCMRVLGKPLGVFVIILDVLKVGLSYWILLKFNKLFNVEFTPNIKSAFMLGTIIGDCFPAYYNLRGGKGIVAGIVVMALLDPQITLICFVCSTVIVICTKTISVGTLAGLILFVIISVIMKREYIVAIIIVALIITFKHRANIYRIFTKQEGKIK